MPVARGGTQTARSMIVLGLSVLAVALLLVGMVVYLAGHGSEIRLGDNQFADLNAERTAKRIADGGPIQFPDVSGGGRVVNLSHVGSDDQTGWYIFDARSPGAASTCLLDWKADQQRFVDRCDAKNTYPVDGAGLHQYAIAVNEAGKLVIDFNVDPKTTTTVVRTTTTAKK